MWNDCCGFLFFIFVFSYCGIIQADILRYPLFELPSPSVGIQAENLFLNAKTSGSPVWADRLGAFAVDGKFSDPGKHWGSENIPVELVLDLGEAKEFNAIKFWPYWDGNRYYQYKIEVSVDGEQWGVVVDRSGNTRAASAKGDFFDFAVTKARFVRVVFSRNSVGNDRGGHIVEIQGYKLSSKEDIESARVYNEWAEVPVGLHAAVGSIDKRYSREDVPFVGDVQVIKASSWKGERVNSQILLWSRDDVGQIRFEVSDLVGSAGTIGADNIRPHFLRYTMGTTRGWEPLQLCADILDTAKIMDIDGGSTRPVWVLIDVPADAGAGNYSGSIKVKALGQADKVFDIELEVMDMVVPSADKWSFHLNLWQNPFAVARYHRVDLWSDEHYALMRPLIEMLAQAGQKVITATLIDRPWGGQTYDPFLEMVEWVKNANGSWSFDYSVFDKWVEFCMACGITEQISCYSMVPWSNSFRYFDVASGEYHFLRSGPGQAAYKEHWRIFLKDLSDHLRQKGWLEKTVISMDERPHAVMGKLMDFMQKEFPEFKVELAVDYPPQEFELYSLSVYIKKTVGIQMEEVNNQRRQSGGITTFYVCTGPHRPNTFTFSPPAESTWLGWYAAANGFDGFLRWAYNSWVQEPLLDTRYVRWPAGDCFMVYPGARSSVRFERLRQGIVDYEKIRIVREKLNQMNNQWAKEQLVLLDETLKQFVYSENIAEGSCDKPVNDAQAVLDNISRQMAGKTK